MEPASAIDCEGEALSRCDEHVAGFLSWNWNTLAAPGCRRSCFSFAEAACRPACKPRTGKPAARASRDLARQPSVSCKRLVSLCAPRFEASSNLGSNRARSCSLPVLHRELLCAACPTVISRRLKRPVNPTSNSRHASAARPLAIRAASSSWESRPRACGTPHALHMGQHPGNRKSTACLR